MEGRLKILSQFNLEDEGVELLKPYPNIDLLMMSGFASRNELIRELPGSFAMIVGTIFKIDKEVLDAAGPQLKVQKLKQLPTIHFAVQMFHKISTLDLKSHFEN